MEQYILSEWGYQGFFSSHLSNARGVGILFNNNFEFKVKKVHRGDVGNSIIVLVEIGQEDFLFVNVYGPNRDNPEFYNNLREKIKQFTVSNIIIGGDFNLVLDPSRDYHNYKNINNPRAKETIDNMITDLDLNDIWRDMNPDCNRYTWRRSTPFQQARLDFFLISDNVVSIVDYTDIECGYRTDHSMILLRLKLNGNNNCKSFWKFNSSLLKDKLYLDEINDEISNIKKEYAASTYERETIDTIPLSDIQLSISDDLFLDFLLMKIRTKTISYATIKKRKTNEEESKLEEDLKQLEKKNSKTDDDIKSIDSKKEQLRVIREKRIEGVILRSRARWVAEGEKVNSYFCNLEKRHFVSKSMARLTDKHGIDLNDQKEILNEVHTFYKSLYKKDVVEDCEIGELVSNIPHLDINEANDLEGEITLEEAGFALKNMKNNKSPGTDGFTAEFFKCFWGKIGVFVVRALNAGFRRGELSSVQKEGMIVSIPKGDKPRNYIQNWRPLSLLNVIYKIGSSCIANRIKNVLPKLISEDQTGFIRNRYIGDNIRLIYDMIAFLEERNLPGLMLNIDFKKAFDSVNWEFMLKVLEAFGFQEGICNWIKTFYKNIKSCALVNGQISSWFEIERGCRQGDPLSPYLFILCAEILAIMVRENKDVQGIEINNVEHKLSQYADDTEFFLAGDKKSFETCMNLLELFGRKSGLQLNVGKTSAVWLGSRKNSNIRYMDHLNLEWNPQRFKILGIWFTNDLKNCSKINHDEKLADVKHLFNVWAKRQITPLGRIAILKSLILSKLIHLWMLLPNPPDSFFKNLQRCCYKFVWNSKTDKINRNTAHKNIKNGGLGLPELKTFAKSLKLTCLRKTFNTNHKWKTVAMFTFPELINLDKFGPEIASTFSKSNAFWTDVFNAYKHFFYRVGSTDSLEILSEPIFYNNRLQIGKQHISGKKWVEKGVYCIAHFIVENGQYISYEGFKQKYNVNMNFVTFLGLKATINQYINTKNSIINDNEHLDTHIGFKYLLSIPKGSKPYYDIIIEDNNRPKCCKTWDEKLDTLNDWKHCFLYLNNVSDIKLKWLQMRILHRCLGTNIILKEMGVVNSDMCSFCNNAKDSIRHIFWQCTVTQGFWKSFVDTLNEKCPNVFNFQMTEPLAVLGFDKNVRIDSIMYFIILLAKQYIYKCKLDKNAPEITCFLAKLRYRYQIEQYIARTNLLYNDLITKWHPYEALCNNRQAYVNRN